MRYILIALLLVALISGPALADTFSIAADIDDASAAIGSTDVNVYTGYTYTQFGRYSLGTPTGLWSYNRWALDLPRASKVTVSHVTYKANASYAPVFNTTIDGLSQASSPAWRETGASGGFHTDNYANGSALNAIGRTSASVTWTGVAAQTEGSSYDTPSMNAVMQEMLDSPYYNPLDSEGAYIGIVIDDGSGTYTWPPYMRQEDSFTGTTPAELDVTITPYGEVMLQGGYRCDVDGLRYYGF